MPKRMWLLAAMYAVLLVALASTQFAFYLPIDFPAEVYLYGAMFAEGALPLLYLTLSTPLGFWGALSKRHWAWRILVCAVPPFTMAVWIVAAPFVVALVESTLDFTSTTITEEFGDSLYPGELLNWILLSALFAFVYSLAPVLCGCIVGWFARRRGLHFAAGADAKRDAHAMRFSLFQLMGLTCAVAILLGIQPILENGYIETIDVAALEAFDQEVVAFGVPNGDEFDEPKPLPPEAMSAQELAFVRAASASYNDEDILDSEVVPVAYDFDVDDDVVYVEPSTAESIVQMVCQGIAFGTPFVIASMICIWAMLFPESPWRRLLWAAPLALLCGGLLMFHDSDAFFASVLMVAFLVPQLAMLGVVRSTGYRLVWSLPATDGDPVRQIA